MSAFPTPGVFHVLLMCLRWFAALALAGVTAHAADWANIDKAELAETKPKVDPDAGAEILQREVMMDHFVFHHELEEVAGTLVTYTVLSGYEDKYYVRIKIFSGRGLDQLALIRIPYTEPAYIKNIAARTIKPNGTIQELRTEDFHDAKMEKSDSATEKAIAFAPPGLEVGSIVEYRYTITSNRGNTFCPIIFQADLPTRKATYKVKEVKHPEMAYFQNRYELRAIAYNCANPKLTPKKGFYTFEFTNLPAFKREKHQPPSLITQTAMLLFIWRKTDVTDTQYWEEFSKQLATEQNDKCKLSPELKGKAAEITSGAASDEEKAQKIYAFCVSKIANRNAPTTHLTKEQEKALKKNRNASDTLQNGIGSDSDINELYIALAQAAGLDARIAACNDRRSLPFNPKIIDSELMMPDRVAAVRILGEWKYCDPGTPYLPFGTLPSKNSDTAILVADESGMEKPVVVAGDPAEANSVLRQGTFKVLANGTLVGDVVETYTGLKQTIEKGTLCDTSPAKQLEYIQDSIREQLKHAQVKNVVIENAADPLAPLKVSYRLRVPGYAERTGTRLLVTPAIFNKGEPPQFVDKERKTNIIFPFRYRVKDAIQIEFPQGYVIETATEPQGITAQGFGSCDVTLNTNRVTNTITYSRELTLTDIKFNKSAYTQVKTVTDQISKLDELTVSAKRDETVSENNALPPEEKDDDSSA